MTKIDQSTWNSSSVPEHKHILNIVLGIYNFVVNLRPTRSALAPRSLILNFCLINQIPSKKPIIEKDSILKSLCLVIFCTLFLYCHTKKPIFGQKVPNFAIHLFWKTYQRSLTLIGMRGGHFYLLVLFGSDFVSLNFINKIFGGENWHKLG